MGHLPACVAVLRPQDRALRGSMFVLACRAEKCSSQLLSARHKSCFQCAPFLKWAGFCHPMYIWRMISAGAAQPAEQSRAHFGDGRLDYAAAARAAGAHVPRLGAGGGLQGGRPGALRGVPRRRQLHRPRAVRVLGLTFLRTTSFLCACRWKPAAICRSAAGCSGQTQETAAAWVHQGACGCPFSQIMIMGSVLPADHMLSQAGHFLQALVIPPLTCNLPYSS